MPTQIYEVVAQGARYWFLFLMAVIVWRSYRWLAKDRRQRKKRLKLLPDAGFVGEMVVQKGSGELEEGAVLLVPQEGVLGTRRGCDLYVPAPGVASKHLWFRYEGDQGVLIKLSSGCKATVDGAEIGRRDETFMVHGSRLAVGEVELRLRMFAGFETTVRAVTMGDGMMPEAVGDGNPDDANAQTAAQVALWQAQQNALQQQYWLMAQQALARQMAAQIPKGEAEAFEDEDANDAQEWEEVLAETRAQGTLYAQAYEMREGVYETPDGEVYVVEGGRNRDQAATYDTPEAYDDESYDVEQGAIPDDHGRMEEELVPRQGKRARAPRSLFNPFEPLPESDQDDRVEESAPRQTFYPPVGGGDFWPYAEYPRSNAVFENHGYTYPEYVESPEEDEDLTDAAAPPKSLYVEPDEAEKAKRVLWDRYLGGGRKR